jgi:23S rRNA (adenine2030-N6)-methyltransferase
LNYRHAYHAGNFADLVKHALLTTCLERVHAQGGALDIIDTHAGAGLYDLEGDAAAKSGEAGQGIVRLLADRAAPAEFGRLKAVIGRLNPAGRLKFYPGSPFLIASALQTGDRLTACELRGDDFAALVEALKGSRATGATALQKDGYAQAAQGLAPPPQGALKTASKASPRPGPKTAPKIPSKRRSLVLIDPPFERADEDVQILRACRAVLGRDPAAVVMVWLPLKDLETFDKFLRDLENARLPPVLIAEARLRRLHDPMRMNGCVMATINGPTGLDQDARAVCGWVAAALGEAGGEARIWRTT